MKTFQYISIRMLSGIGSDGRSIDSVGNGATDGTTHNSSVQQNTNNEHSGHNNTGDHNSLAQSGGASAHEGMLKNIPLVMEIYNSIKLKYEQLLL